ncbi:ABC-type transport auxiliary lipoprotein family protein [Sulfurovum sp. XTW-4]|uniref:ABC-type transport auxiliary lipoprotein family protein n=1 Tax=Sulfurovum xiamenensis TaxID=3019066 RepID=A0ABT7QTW2_9BACT|nr:ABC-type transport auxiliary lipoprotein family protein [Sulfurovum xiamenensis]MDM5264523.1 ABC-type transport auxiliary lipoprotein family protein [Sulfurovum xiamenensis]
MRKSRLTHIVSMMIVAGFIGCSKAPVLNVYSLNAPQILIERANAYKDKSIKVTFPQSIKEPMSEKMRFSYTMNDRGTYQNSQWSNNMSRLLQGTFIEVLDSSRLFKVVLSDMSTLEENYRLESTIFDFEHQVRGRDSYAVVSIQFTLIDEDRGRLVKSKRFSYQEPTLTTDAKGYAIATNRIIAKLSQDLLRWLK